MSIHMSGGRDVWTGPLASTPADPLASTWTALNEVLDPEIPISVVELGLIYGVELKESVVTVRLTFTATACPCMGFIREDISDRLEQEPWVERVEIVEVWDPPWTNDRITDEGRARLKQLGVGV
jgi:metal-sulfur cluster biosynthetic enzyme